jgi:DNA polymerase zeta
MLKYCIVRILIVPRYAEMPRRTIAGLPTCTNNAGPSRPRGTISQYFATVECAVCRQQTREGLCVECQTQPQKAAVVLSNKLRRWERAASNMAKVINLVMYYNFVTLYQKKKHITACSELN